MAADKIGDARCPLCGGTARVSLAKSQLVVMTMNCCNAQLFARSDRSDALVRGLLIKPAAQAEEPAAVEPAAVQEPPKAEPVPVTPAPARSPFSMFGG